MAKDLNTSKLSEVGMYGEEPFVGYEVTQPSEVLPIGIDSTVLDGVFAASGDMAAIASIGREVKLPESPKVREAFLKKWAEKAAEKARANKGLSATVLILPLAACGGTDVSLFKADLTVAQVNAQFASLQANGYSIKDSAANITAAIGATPNVLAGATQVALASNAAITVTDSNALAALTNFVGFNGTVTLSDHGSITVAPSVDTYVLADSGANTITVPASNLDVNITGGTAADTVNVAGRTVSGTYTLGSTDTIVATTGADITGVNAGAATSAGQLELSGAITMTQAQHEAFIAGGGIIDGDGATSAEQVTITTSGAITASHVIETYVLANNTLTNTVTVASTGTAVNVTSGANNTTTVAVGANAVTGTYALGGSADVITISNGGNLSGVNAGADTTAEVLALSTDKDSTTAGDDNLGSEVTMTVAQHEAFSTITAGGTADRITFSAAGDVTTINAEAAIETYVLAGTSGQTNTMNVNAGNAAVTINGAASDDTINVSGLIVTGTLAFADGANVLRASDGANLVDATLSATGGTLVLEVADASTVTVDSDQLITLAGSEPFNDITVSGEDTSSPQDETITVNTTTGALVGGYTLDADIENWNIGTTGNGNNDVTSGADAQNVTFGTGNDTIRFTSAGFDSVDSVNGGDGADTIRITDNATVVDSDFDNVASVETLLLSGTGAQNVTLAALHSDAAGIRTVTATAGTASTIDIGGTAAGLAVATNAGNDTVIAGSGADNISTGTGDDVIRFLSANFTAADTVAGGADNDTIQITDNATVVDLDFDNVSSVETLLLSGTGAQNVTLAADANAAGIRTVTATAGTASTIDISGTTAGLTVTTNAGNDTVIAGSGADNISTGTGDDVIRFTAAGLTSADAVNGGDNTDTIEITTAAIGGNAIVDADFTNVTFVETLLLSAAGTATLGNGAYVAGIRTFTGSSGNDTVRLSLTDSQRGDMTINLAAGGQDTILIDNAAIGNNGSEGTVGGLGGRLVDRNASAVTLESNADTLNATIADWNAAGTGGVGNAGIEYVTINGFAAGNGGDRIAYMNGASQTLVGGYADNVSLTTNNLSGLAVNSVIEIDSAFQINDGNNLGAVATTLTELNNVQDGNYYIVIYDGTSTNSNAWIYAATATEGDGFDFADANGATNGYDTDTVELIGFLMGVGADTLTSQNFISSNGIVA